MTSLAAEPITHAGTELTLAKGNGLRSALDVLGNPPVALLLAVLLAMWTLGHRAGFDRRQVV